jgi:hypothetical protein
MAFPVTTVARRRSEEVLSALGPTFFLTSEDSTYVDLLDGFGDTIRSALVQPKDPRRFPWQLAFAVDVSLELLGQRGELQRLSDVSTWRVIASDLTQSVPPRSRLFRDLMDGFDRRWGGRSVVEAAAIHHLRL